MLIYNNCTAEVITYNYLLPSKVPSYVATYYRTSVLPYYFCSSVRVPEVLNRCTEGINVYHLEGMNRLCVHVEVT